MREECGILRHLGEWLSPSRHDIEKRYFEIGGARVSRVALSDFCGLLLKRIYPGNLSAQGSASPVEIYGEMELLRLLDML